MQLQLRRLYVPKWAEGFQVDKDSFWLHNTWYEYAILSSERLRERYPRFPEAFTMTRSFLAVSDTYPKRYRRAAIVRDAFEGSIEKKKNACELSLDFELKQLPVLGVYDGCAYVRFRYAFFKRIVEHFESLRRDATEDDWYRHALRSRNRLLVVADSPAAS